MQAPDPLKSKVSPLRPLPNLIFASRWLQLPLYLGLIAAQAVYVVHFLVELEHGSAEKGKATERKFTLKRGADFRLRVVES